MVWISLSPFGDYGRRETKQLPESPVSKVFQGIKDFVFALWNGSTTVRSSVDLSAEPTETDGDQVQEPSTTYGSVAMPSEEVVEERGRQRSR